MNSQVSSGEINVLVTHLFKPKNTGVVRSLLLSLVEAISIMSFYSKYIWCTSVCRHESIIPCDSA